MRGSRYAPAGRFQIAVFEYDCLSTDELPQLFQGEAQSVLSASGGKLRVQLTGATATFGHIPACGRYVSCTGASIRAAAAPATFVCLVGAGSSAGRDIPAPLPVTVDVYRI